MSSQVHEMPAYPKVHIQTSKVGEVDNPEARVLRVVHISDTHMRHDDFLPSIPSGDILIHSGDFSAFSVGRYFGNRSRDAEELIRNLDTFFEKLPHKHKIFIAGNHEMGFTKRNREFIETQLQHVTYLQDKSLTVEGINIHGSPWSNKRWTSYARGFSRSYPGLQKYWELIPTDTDILVTHLPPQGIMDLATKKFKSFKNIFSASEGFCSVCGLQHPSHDHWGCPELKKTVLNRVRPILHLYGHVHETTGIETVDGVTFSNAAMKIMKAINVFDLHVPSTNQQTVGTG